MSIPADDLSRHLKVAAADDPGMLHLGLVGDTYTILISGKDTAGLYSLIDMYVPPGGGPLPHRHDFEERSRCLKARLRRRFGARGSRYGRTGDSNSS